MKDSYLEEFDRETTIAIRTDIRQLPMVRWYHPPQLMRTALRALLSSVIGGYADRREVIAALDPDKPSTNDDYSKSNELWLDYVSDTGDGWDSTYTVARLISEPVLDVAFKDKSRVSLKDELHATSRGSVLVMGGDLVYPTPTRKNYQERLIAPYSDALPQTKDEPLSLFVLPGNHDWYDGLNAFLRWFLQDRQIGGRKTTQKRSYFALKLPHNWWLLGVDVQLSGDLDRPQLDYFKEIVSSSIPSDTPANIVLCTPIPAWVYPTAIGESGESALLRLRSLETEVLAENHRLRLVLAGDFHHYSRYFNKENDVHRITAGGGGAYLSPTHNLSDQITLAPRHQGGGDFELAEVYPSKKISKGLGWHCVYRMGLTNTYLIPTLGGIYLWCAWVIQSVSKMRGGSYMDAIYSKSLVADFGFIFGNLVRLLAHSPFTVIIVCLLILGGAIWSRSSAGDGSPVEKQIATALGLAHGTLHVLLLVVAMWAFARINLGVFGLDTDSLGQVVLFSFEMLAIAGTVGVVLIGLYIWIANASLKIHYNDMFACQSIADYKNFVRLHFGTDGSLTVYPVGVDRVCRKWIDTAVKDDRNRSPAKRSTGTVLKGKVSRELVGPSEPRFQPSLSEPLSSLAHLIEPPIRIEP